MTDSRIRVLIVDDSALVRSVLVKVLSRFPDLEIVGTASDPYEARDLLVRQRPHVMTLDVEMPRMDGIRFLRKLMAVLPTPTIVLSSLTRADSPVRADALAAGAVAVLAKPSVGLQLGLEQMVQRLVDTIRAAAATRVERRPAEPQDRDAPSALEVTTELVIALGASAGGVTALGRILPRLPASSPGIVLVQHMAAGFTADFARRLDAQCQVRVSEAVDGQRVLRGHLLVAPGGARHCEVVRAGGEYRIRLQEGAPVSGHVPSVSVLFASLAQCAGKNAAACLLTGMGADGADGLLRLRLAGGYTLAQDRATSAVWGMPAAAEALGAARAHLPLAEIPGALTEWAKGAAVR